MEISQVRQDIEAIEHNTDLYDEANFSGRSQAVDFLDFIINSPSHSVLQQSANTLKRTLEDIDAGVFKKLRAAIRSGNYTHEELRALPGKYFNDSPQLEMDTAGYDHLDIFINGLLNAGRIPRETLVREPEMVFFQKTPARVIWEMVALAPVGREDIFYDIGSGLGQVAILVNLLSGAHAKGVEVEPAYCEYARTCAARLRLSHVEIVQADARAADISDGTVFFMFTPFKGRILDDVLKKLYEISRRRSITLCTYGPCSAVISQQSWLTCAGRENFDNQHDLYVFKSI